MEEKAPGNKVLLLKYAGMAFQFMSIIGLAVWAGWIIDKKLIGGMPLLTWLLPLLAIVALIVKAVGDTGKTNKEQ